MSEYDNADLDGPAKKITPEFNIDDSIKIGERIMWARNFRGVSQMALALDIQKSGGGLISQYETGKKTPSLKTLSKISERLDAPLSLVLFPKYLSKINFIRALTYWDILSDHEDDSPTLVTIDHIISAAPPKK